MTSRERIAAACAHREPDQLPWISAAASRPASTSAWCTSCGRRSAWTRPARRSRWSSPTRCWARWRPTCARRSGSNGLPARHRNDVRLPARSSRNGSCPTARRCWCRRTSTRSTSPTATCSSGPGTTAPCRPAAQMPAGGHFFDAIIRQEPIDEERLDPRDNTEEFGPVAEAELAHLRRAGRAAVRRPPTRRCSAPSAG